MKTASEWANEIRLRSEGNFDGEIVVHERITKAIKQAVDAAVVEVLKRPDGKLPPAVADVVESLEAQLAERDAQCAAMREALTTYAVRSIGADNDPRGFYNDCEMCNADDHSKETGVVHEPDCILASDAGSALLRVVGTATQLRDLLDWAEKNSDGVMGGSVEHQKLREALAAIGR